MIKVYLLEDTDIIEPTDWCRPLEMVSMNGSSDNYSFINTFSGLPENNAKWVQVDDIIGEVWHGKPVSNFSLKYEFIRGKIPSLHKLDMSNYTSMYNIAY